MLFGSHFSSYQLTGIIGIDSIKEPTSFWTSQIPFDTKSFHSQNLTANLRIK
jgi:hypothetical protein